MAEIAETEHSATIFATLVISLILLKITIRELIQDTRYVSHWFQTLIKEVKITRKLSPDTALDYFSTAFDDLKHLVKGMAKNNSILSGSRALEYLLPGFSLPDSDWDFYMPHNRACLAGAMHTLAKCGVVWDDYLTPYRRLFHANKEEIMHLTKNTAETLAHTWVRRNNGKRARDAESDCHILDLVAGIQDAIAEMDKYSNLMERKVQIKSTTVFVDAPNDHKKSYGSSIPDPDWKASSYGPRMHIIRGTTTFNGTSHTVQLISSHGKSPIDLILASYASHAQCFVSAFGAAHLYYPSFKTATTWPLNTQHRPSADAAFVDYKQRGFTFKSRGNKHGHRTLRRLDDRFSAAKCKFVEFTFPFAFDDVPETMRSLRRQALRKLMRIETAERTWRVADAEGGRSLADVRKGESQACA